MKTTMTRQSSHAVEPGPAQRHRVPPWTQVSRGRSWAHIARMTPYAQVFAGPPVVHVVEIAPHASKTRWWRAAFGALLVGCCPRAFFSGPQFLFVARRFFFAVVFEDRR